MALRISELSELDPDLVAQLFAETTQLVQEAYPAVELIRGPIHDLVLHLAGGVLSGLVQTNVDRVLQSRSLLAISEDPTLDDPTLVDHILSNHRISRDPGSRATGEITIVVSADETTIIPAGLGFTANGLVFLADTAFTGRSTTGAITSITDRALRPLGDGTFAFTITATAELEGAAGNIRRGTKMVPAALPSRYVTAYAARDFNDGFAAETNQELLDKLVQGDAAKTMGGRENLIALIKHQTPFERTLDYSVIGFGDAEMQRDQHWIWPSSGGGRVDVYAQTRAMPISTNKTVTATLVDSTAAGTVWQFTRDREVSPGFYQVERIVHLDAGSDDPGYEVTFDQRGYDLSGSGLIPDITSSLEAAYTRYQTAVIRFLDTDTLGTGLTVGTSTAEYQIAILGMPLIAELQEFVSDRAIANRASDTLIKAPVPCFLSVTFDLRKGLGESTPDLDAIANALADEVNEMGFTGQLHASQLAAVVHDQLIGKQATGAMDLFGRIRRGDGTLGYIRSDSILRIPDDPARLVTGRTTLFILDPRDVTVNVVAAGFADV